MNGCVQSCWLDGLNAGKSSHSIKYLCFFLTVPRVPPSLEGVGLDDLLTQTILIPGFYFFPMILGNGSKTRLYLGFYTSLKYLLKFLFEPLSLQGGCEVDDCPGKL